LIQKARSYLNSKEDVAVESHTLSEQRLIASALVPLLVKSERIQNTMALQLEQQQTLAPLVNQLQVLIHRMKRLQKRQQRHSDERIDGNTNAIAAFAYGSVTIAQNKTSRRSSKHSTEDSNELSKLIEQIDVSRSVFRGNGAQLFFFRIPKNYWRLEETQYNYHCMSNFLRLLLRLVFMQMNVAVAQKKDDSALLLPLVKKR